MLRHLKYSIPDFIFCLLASVGLAVNVVQSFLLPEALSADVPRMFLVCAVTIFVLILLSFNRRTAIWGAVGVMALVVLLLALSVAGVIPRFEEHADAELNANLWYPIVAMCAMLVYLLSRTRAGTWFLLIFGVIMSAYFLLLKYIYYVWGLVLLLWSVGTWLCYITYRRKLLMQANASRTAFLPVTLHAAGVSTLCVLLGCLLWWGVIRPLQPGTRDLALYYEVFQSDVMEVIGVYEPKVVYDPNTASTDVEDTDWSNEQEEDPESENTEQADGVQDTEHDQEQNDAEETLDADQEEGSAQYVNYQSREVPEFPLIIVLIACLLVLAGLLTLFFRRRKIWYRRITKGLDDEGYIRLFYPFYLRKFRVLRLPEPKGSTPMEYAAQLEDSTRFLDDTGVTWQELTGIYHRVVYSGRPPEPEDKGKFEQFYKGFFRCCRKHLRLAWLWKSFRL